MSIFFTRGSHLHTASIVACVALLSACGSNPEPIESNTSVANEVVEEVTNVADIVQNSAVGNETAPPAAAASPAAKETTVAAAKPAPAATAPEAPAETASAGNASNGAKLFAQCRICHAVEPGKNGLGPSLHATAGRTAGTLAGFSYSPAMKGSGVVWNDDNLNDYLRSPMKFLPGTKMAYAGMSNDTQRADMIAYLKTLK